MGDSDVNDLMSEAQMINGSQNEISKVYRKCKNLGGNTAHQQARQRLHQQQQSLRIAELCKSEEMIRELDFCDAATFPLLF